MQLYPIFGTGHPILKVYNASNTLISTATMSSTYATVIENTVLMEKNDIQYENLDGDAKVRKGIRRLKGTIVLDNLATSIIDTLMAAIDYDGVYGWRIELQPFSGNSSFKLDVHLSDAPLPQNAGNKLYGRYQMVINWYAEDANILFSTIKKYS